MSSSVKARARCSSTADVGDLQSVIDLFLTRLEPYRVELEGEAEDIEEATDSTIVVDEVDESVKAQRLASNSSQADQLGNPDLPPSRSVSDTPSSSSSTSEVS